METHIHTRWYTSSVGVQHGNTHLHKGIYKLRGSPAWKHTFTQEDKAALWESNMETHIHTRMWIYKLCGSPPWKYIFTQGDIDKLCESPSWKHTFTQGDSGVNLVWNLRVVDSGQKISIFPGKFLKNFDFSQVNFQRNSIFQASFRKISISSGNLKKCQFSGKNCLFTATSGQIILFLFKSHHFRT